MSTMVTDRKGIGGPNTPEGMLIASLNALKHGLYAQSAKAMENLVEKAGVPFEPMLKEFMDYYKPQDPTEQMLVRRIAVCSWRLMLTETEQIGLFESGDLSTTYGSYHAMLKAERLVDIMLHRALTALTKKRKLAKCESVRNEPEQPLADSSPLFLGEGPGVRLETPEPCTASPQQREYDNVRNELPPSAPDTVGGVSDPDKIHDPDALEVLSMMLSP